MYLRQVRLCGCGLVRLGAAGASVGFAAGEHRLVAGLTQLARQHKEFYCTYASAVSTEALALSFANVLEQQ